MANLHPDTLLRQWRMLQMIPRFPQKVTARELHGKLQAEQFNRTDGHRQQIFEHRD